MTTRLVDDQAVGEVQRVQQDLGLRGKATALHADPKQRALGTWDVDCRPHARLAGFRGVVRTLGEPDRPSRIAHRRVDAVAMLEDPLGRAGRHVHAVDPAVENIRGQQVRPARLERDAVGAAALIRRMVDVPGRRQVAERGAGAVQLYATQPVDLVGHDEAAIGKRDPILRASKRAITRKDHGRVVGPLRQRRRLIRASITRVASAAGHEEDARNAQRHAHDDPARPIQIH